MTEEYSKGYYDFFDGRSCTENPYEYNTDSYVSWEAGWTQGWEEQEEIDMEDYA